jgi:uncharacterized protein YaaR (DUF327 family)
MINIFNEIETGILNKWVRLEHSSSVETKGTTGSSQYYNKIKDMAQQLRSGVISVWKNEMRQCDRSQFQHFIIKISGVWENEGGCGLTFKFI